MAIRRLEQRLPPRSIRWEFVNLIEPDPLRRVKLRMSSQKLTELHPADLAEIMEELRPPNARALSIRCPKTPRPKPSPSSTNACKRKWSKTHPEKAADILEEMNPDEAADLIASLPPDTAKEVVEEMEGQEKTEVEALMRYEENTAGGMMNTELVVVGEDATRGEVVDYIRFNEIVPDQLDNGVRDFHALS
jgi:Mg/Co/Ni transporter MgtE